MKKKSFLFGTLILIIVNFIVRFLGFAYKILLSRMIGAEAIGLFHLVFPVLMTCITFTTAGIPVAVSKLVAKNISLGNKRGCNKILFLSLLFGVIICALLSFSLLYFASFISTSIIKNTDTYYSIIALIPAIFLITLSSIFRGYYYGIQDVATAGTSQIMEQFVRIIFVLGFLSLLQSLEPKYAAVIAVIGISLGELTGFLWLLFRFKFGEALHLRKTYFVLREGSLKILASVILIAVPITTSRLIGVMMQTVNAVLIPQKLEQAGYSSQQAIAAFGKLSGMAMPLLFLPFIVTSALVVNIIPSLSEEIAVKNWTSIGLKSSIAIRMTLLISIPLSAVFIFFAAPICDLIYNEPEVGMYLSLLSFSVIFLSLQHTLSGILHGIGKEVRATANYLIGMSLQLFCTLYLVPNPSFGVNGFILGFILATITISLLNLFTLTRCIKIRIDLTNAVIKPIMATIIMILFIVNSHALLVRNVSRASALLLSMGIGFFTYIIIILLTGCLRIKTLQYILRRQ
ncbi:MAG: stage V sporulation protein B [Bacillota bacterium]